jgi:hypothetical protein
MQKLLPLLLAATLLSPAHAQQTEFEGHVVYKVDVTSKMEGFTNEHLRHVLVLGDTSSVAIKEGNYRISNALSTTYFINKDQKAYLHFKGIDTLYYLGYNSDTSQVTKVSKTSQTKQIMGQDCKGIVMEFAGYRKHFYYAPALYRNPDHDRNNRQGRFDVLAKETSAIWLSSVEQHSNYVVNQQCVRLEPAALPSSIFTLPDLPRKPFTYDAISSEPQFSGPDNFSSFLTKNLDADFGGRYVKIPRGEQQGTKQVLVGFYISEEGKLSEPNVINRREVHPKLAEEALRVISLFPTWQPATILGKPFRFYMRQPITFSVSKG